MSNHVHVLLKAPTERPVSLSRIVSSHKSFTARRANIILGRSGAFWELGYFDRTVRPQQLDRVSKYILDNPVKAGTITHWRDWPYTYHHPDLFLPDQ